MYGIQERRKAAVDPVVQGRGAAEMLLTNMDPDGDIQGWSKAIALREIPEPGREEQISKLPRNSERLALCWSDNSQDHFEARVVLKPH